MKRPSYIVPHDTPLLPARPGVRYVRLPLVGIVVADDALRARVERLFHSPMIVLALLILPLLVLDLIYFTQHGTLPVGDTVMGTTNFVGPPVPDASAAANEPPPPPGEIFIRIGFALIWFAFFLEFVIKITIAESRIEYVKRNWLDIIIICLPLLRPIRAIQAAKVARTSKVFALRGVGMKFLRYFLTFIVGMEATERLLERFGIKRKKGRIDPVRMTRYQLMDEVKTLRRHADHWEEWWEGFEVYRAEHDLPPAPNEPPEVEASAEESDETTDPRSDEGGADLGTVV